MKEYLVTGLLWHGGIDHHFDITPPEDQSEENIGHALEAARIRVSGFRITEINNGAGYVIGDHTDNGIQVTELKNNFSSGAAITFDNGGVFTFSKDAVIGQTSINGVLSNADVSSSDKVIPVSIYKVNDDDSVELVE
ncbi:MAG: hypothetical protein QF704_12170 [Anaerolineales bacterium]|nr:hypothetical protein [Anaerolineales bacterium]